MRVLTQSFISLLVAMAFALSLTVNISSADERSVLDQQKAALFKDLANASSEQEGRAAESAVWRYWFNQAPTPEVRASLDAGIERREAYDFEAAENHLDLVVEAAPDYSEGHNQRAFVRFLRENYAAAQTDLETALELEPDHFGAMSGLHHILRIQNRHEAAMALLQQAVIIHPWLNERSALPKKMWPDSYRAIHEPGQEI